MMHHGVMSRWLAAGAWWLSVAAFAATSLQVEQPQLPLVLPPYLQNPAAGSMTVSLAAQGAETVRVAWGVPGAPPVEVAAVETPVAGTPWTVWKTRLTNLATGVEIAYAVRYRAGGMETSTPTFVFRTVDEASTSLRWAAFNDLHNRDATLAALMQHVKPADFEFSLLLGDCWADPRGDKGAYEVFRTLNAYVRLLDASRKPMIVIRGNHETRGDFAGRLATLFDLPLLDSAGPADRQRWQFTLRWGPVHFIAMDTGEDGGAGTPTNSYKRPLHWHEVRQAEADWLRETLARRPGDAAAWRLFVSHIPLYNSNWDFSDPARELWEPLLPGARIDLMLAGHDHGWKLLPRDSRYELAVKRNGLSTNRVVQVPCPVLIGGGPALNEGTVMLLQADTRALQARLLAAEDGRVLATFAAPPAARP